MAVFLLIPASWTRVSRLNLAIDTASDSYAEAKYDASVKNHLVLIEEFQYSSPELDFNLGLSYHHSEKPDEAAGYYDKTSVTPNKLLASFGYNQGGVILGTKQEYEAALSKFQSALIKDPMNEVARYNYEKMAAKGRRTEKSGSK